MLSFCNFHLSEIMNMKRIAFWKESCKFLSGAFFVTAWASWYFAYYNVSVPFLNTTMSPRFLAIRGAFHFLLFVFTFFFGFIKKSKP